MNTHHRNYGVGEGVGYTKVQCEEMWGDINLDDHVMLVHEATTPNHNATTTPTTAGFATTPNPTTSSVTNFGSASTPHPNTTTTPTNTNYTMTDDTNSSTRFTTPITTADVTVEVRPGDSLEVWWDEYDQWYPCVVTDVAPDVGDTVAHLCHYDEERRGRWHNMEVKSCYDYNTNSHVHACSLRRMFDTAVYPQPWKGS